MKKKIIINTIANIIKKKPEDIKLSFGIGSVDDWDSLAQIRIYLELKKKLKYTGNINDLAKIKTVKDWITFFSKSK